MLYLQRYLVVTWLMPRETAAVSARSVYTVQLCTMSCHFMQSHIHRAHACLVVTCHLHFRQNDRDRLRATAVTRGWNEYQNNRLLSLCSLLLVVFLMSNQSLFHPLLAPVKLAILPKNPNLLVARHSVKSVIYLN